MRRLAGVRIMGARDASGRFLVAESGISVDFLLGEHRRRRKPARFQTYPKGRRSRRVAPCAMALIPVSPPRQFGTRHGSQRLCNPKGFYKRSANRLRVDEVWVSRFSTLGRFLLERRSGRVAGGRGAWPNDIRSRCGIGVFGCRELPRLPVFPRISYLWRQPPPPLVISRGARRELAILRAFADYRVAVIDAVGDPPAARDFGAGRNLAPVGDSSGRAQIAESQ